MEGNKEEIDEAYANDYIDDDLSVKWDETSEMKKTGDALDKLSSFMNSDLDSTFYESYEENFDVPLNLNNKLFWEELFDITISFS